MMLCAEDGEDTGDWRGRKKYDRRKIFMRDEDDGEERWVIRLGVWILVRCSVTNMRPKDTYVRSPTPPSTSPAAREQSALCCRISKE